MQVLQPMYVEVGISLPHMVQRVRKRGTSGCFKW